MSKKKQVVSLQNELSYVQAHLATLELPQPPPATVTSSGSLPPLSISDLPTITPSMYDLSPIFEPMSSTWPMQQQPRPSDHLFGVSQSSSIGGGGEFQAIAREFLHGGQMSAHQPPPETGGSAPTVIKREWCLYYIYIYIYVGSVLDLMRSIISHMLLFVICIYNTWSKNSHFNFWL